MLGTVGWAEKRVPEVRSEAGIQRKGRDSTLGLVRREVARALYFK